MKYFPLCQLVWFIAFSLPQCAQATYIRIVPTFEARLSGKTVAVSLVLHNEGNESARDVAVEFLSLRETRPGVSELASNQQITLDYVFRWDQCSISKEGSYSLLYRIHYTDQNSFRFTAPYLGRIDFVPLVTTPVSVSLENPDGSGSIVLGAEEERLQATIRNISKFPVEVQELIPFSATELAVGIRKANPPLLLMSQESLEFELTVKNIATLPGSSYPVYLVASGIANEKHYSGSAYLLGTTTVTNSDRLLIAIFTILSVSAFWYLALAVKKLRRKTEAP